MNSLLLIILITANLAVILYGYTKTSVVQSAIKNGTNGIRRHLLRVEVINLIVVSTAFGLTDYTGLDAIVVGILIFVFTLASVDTMLNMGKILATIGGKTRNPCLDDTLLLKIKQCVIPVAAIIVAAG